MINNQVKDLFQLHSELTDAKVDMAVSKAIDRVIDKINDLRNDMHELRHDMHTQITDLGIRMSSEFALLDKRVVAIETRLGIVGEKQKGLYNRFIDYLFKAGYSIITFATLYMAYLLMQIHLVK